MGGIIGIVGRSGSGKTTLICRLIGALGNRRIAVIKRTHHLVPGFSGGKDTDRYLEAGAAEAILVTPLALHHWTEERAHHESPLVSIEDAVETAARSAELVILESAKYDGTWPRLVVHASSIGLPDPLPPKLEAIISDRSDPILAGVRQFHRDETEEIARLVIRASMKNQH